MGTVSNRTMRARIAALALAATPLLACAAPAGRLPPPGLYQIDMDSTFTTGQGSSRTRIDSSAGERVDRTDMAGVDSVERRTQGVAPVQHCVGAREEAGAFAVAPNGTPLRCSKQTTVTVGDATEHHAVCPGGNLKLTVRQLDGTHWEYASEVEAGGAGVPSDLNAMRPLLEHEASMGKTEQARAQARARLAALPAMQAEGVQKRAEARERLEAALRKERDPGQREALRKAISLIGGTVPVTAHTRYLWTRIADSCGAAQRP